MRQSIRFFFTLCCLASAGLLPAQEENSPVSATEVVPEPAAPTTADSVEDRVKDAMTTGADTVQQISKDVDADPRAKEISAGILNPIYQLAEFLGFAAFHWLAFAIMATGVVNYALQLIIGKLVLLTRLHVSVTEILSDALGLVISLVGLVLTTQAAAENSTFTQSPASVLSAAAVGILFGFIFYRWGQSQELRAARGTAVTKR